MGSGIMLVSDDPYGGRGILHVVDVRDPANPHVISTLSTWARGLTNLFTRTARARHRAHRHVHRRLPLGVARRLAGRHRHRRPARPGAPPDRQALRRQGGRGRVRDPRRAGRRGRARVGHRLVRDGGVRHLGPAPPEARVPHEPRGQVRPVQRLHPPQLAPDPQERRGDHGGGLRPRRLQARGHAADLADQAQPQAAPARHVRRGARRRVEGRLLGPLLRRARRPDRPGLLRAGDAADRRAPPGPAAAGRLPHRAPRDDLGRPVRADRPDRLDDLLARPRARHRRDRDRPRRAQADQPPRRPARARSPEGRLRALHHGRLRGRAARAAPRPTSSSPTGAADRSTSR